FCMSVWHPPLSTPFPYTTLFRSLARFQRSLLRGGLWDIGDDDTVEVRLLAPVVLVADQHRLHLRVPRFQNVRARAGGGAVQERLDRKSTRLNSSHVKISYAVFCL